MCIIAIKKQGVNMPEEKTLQTMFKNNPDGAGLMYTRDNKVVISKGFMSYEDFKTEIDELSRSIDLLNTPMILHFRITTHGGTNPENTHPFTVVSDYSIMGKPRGYTKLGMVHNGIISNLNHTNKNVSDTMQFIKEVVYPLYKTNSNFIHNKNALTLLSNIACSKLAFLNHKGDIATVGEFIESADGMLYSNSSYKDYKSYATYCGCNDSYSFSNKNYLGGFEYEMYDENDIYHDNEAVFENIMPLYGTNAIIEYSDGQIDDYVNDYYIDKNGMVFVYHWYYERFLPVDAYAYGVEYDKTKATFENIDYSIMVENIEQLEKGLY